MVGEAHARSDIGAEGALAMRGMWSSIDGNAGLHGFTCKLGIAGQDIYVKVALRSIPDGTSALDYVDVTLSSPPLSDETWVTHHHARIETTKTDDARAMIELLCRQANVLLQSETWEWDDLCDAWSGTRFDPCGPCEFPASCSIGGAIVSSPLDAAARVIRDRFSAWGAHVDRISSVPPAPGAP